jgi:23S rRNA (cytosine1962-C5)-methyltransferase
MAILKLKPGREKSLHRKHPWVFSGAVFRMIDDGTALVPGATVKIVDSKDEFLAWGAYSPDSQIRARVWSWDINHDINKSFFLARLEEAFSLRKTFISIHTTNAFRLVHGESDGLPGLIVDKYGDVIVVQFLSSGAEYWRQTLTGLLAEFGGCESIYERSDADSRSLEGLPARSGLLWGRSLEGRVKVYENDVDYWVDVVRGHKTGFYLDQRDNRTVVRDLASRRSVLDCFTYTGGFTLSAIKGGAASITSMDTSEGALDLARENLLLNSMDPNLVEWVAEDVFQTLRKYRDRNRKFDLIILDPPKFAPTTAQVQKAARGYKDINLSALKLLNPGGILITFSCSGGVGGELFQRIVAGAALDAGKQARIVKRLSQAADHPVALNFPEGAYLKGLVIQISENK